MLDQKIKFLKTVRIFAELTDTQLERIAMIAKSYEIKEQTILANQRDIADSLYIVFKGCLATYQMQGGTQIKIDQYHAGDYFDEQWLFGEDVHPATIQAEEDSHIYMIHEEDFELFIDQFPDAILDMPESVWDELDQARSIPSPPLPIAPAVTTTHHKLALAPGETVIYESHRTRFILIAALCTPFLVIVILPLLTWLVTGYLLELRLLYIAICLAVAMLPGVSLAIWRYLDWHNDYLIITNYHLVHCEFELSTFENVIIKIPHDQIQSISVLREGILATILGIGTVKVTTASQSDGVNFDLIHNPDEAEAKLNEARQYTENIEHDRERTAVREAIEEHFQPQGTPLPSSNNPQEGVQPSDTSTITYQRHWFILLQAIIAQCVGIIVLLAIIALLVTILPHFWMPIAIVGSLLFLALFGWTYYQYEDWRNDLFQLTSTMVIDIDRRPFRMDEDRKTADLKNVQNVQINRSSFVATIFGFGDVVIDTAGANAQIIFEDVKNPIQVQTDIFARRTQILHQEDTDGVADRRQEMLLMLDEYHQLSEDRKIPHATPFVESDQSPNPEDR